MNYRAAQIAEALGVSKRTISRRAVREGWLGVEQVDRGGVFKVFEIDALPADVRNAMYSFNATAVLEKSAPVSVAVLLQAEVSAIATPVTAPALRRANNPSTDRQRQIAEARAAILAAIDNIKTTLQVSQQKAILEIIARAKSNSLPPHLMALIAVANAKATENRTLSERTIKNWIAAAKDAKNPAVAVTALTPKIPQPSADIPDWAAPLLAEFQHPQKPTLRAAVCKLIQDQRWSHLSEDVLYKRAARFFEKIGSAELQRGRMSPQARKAELAFRRRKTGGMLPGDGYTADGHTFDAEVAHPEKYGRPFRPEVTTIIDIATRRVVGWSVNLAESTITVLDALRAACETCGVCALFYTDNGPGYKNHAMTAEGTGLLAHLGITATHSRPYNSQARGIIERSHQTIWVSAAKELATYIGKDMDREMSTKVHKLTRAEINAGRRSPMLMEFGAFTAFAQQKIDEYNNRPHRGLAKRYDPALGKKRHLTPMEAWAEGEQAAKDAGLWVVSADDARDLIRPQVTRVAQRCELNVFNNKYFSKALEQFNGERVRVAYDVRNAENVIVYNSDGQYLCHAKLDGNADPYFAKPVIEQANDKRTARRLKLHDAKRDAIENEFTREVRTLENAPSPTLSDLVAEAEQVSAEVIHIAQPVRPLFATDADRYEWLMTNRNAWTARDSEWLLDHIQTESYAAMTDYWAARGLQYETATPQLKEA